MSAFFGIDLFCRRVAKWNWPRRYPLFNSVRNWTHIARLILYAHLTRFHCHDAYLFSHFFTYCTKVQLLAVFWRAFLALIYHRSRLVNWANPLVLCYEVQLHLVLNLSTHLPRGMTRLWVILIPLTNSDYTHTCSFNNMQVHIVCVS